MSLFKRLAAGDIETWFGTCLVGALVALTVVACTAMFSTHEPNCYYPYTYNPSFAKPFIIKGNVDWAEDHTAFRFDTSDERDVKLESLIQCATK